MFFLLGEKGKRVSLQQTVVDAVRGLGFDLVDLERLGGGVLRVTIDWPWQPGAPERAVTVDDCERVSNQLQYALEVEGVDYARLEVSSPGVERPLRDARDFERFAGAVAEVTLREPFEGRKKFRGALQRGEGDGWMLVWREAPRAKPGQRVSARRMAAAPEHALNFTLEEVQSARLAPELDFKGRAQDAGALQPEVSEQTQTDE